MRKKHVQHLCPSNMFPLQDFGAMFQSLASKETNLLHSHSLGIQSPSENGFLEPKYLPFRRWLYTPIIIWQGEPGSLGIRKPGIPFWISAVLLHSLMPWPPIRWTKDVGATQKYGTTQSGWDVVGFLGGGYGELKVDDDGWNGIDIS